MQFTTLSALGAMLAMTPAVMSHMIMQSPVPYGSPNNSPLSPSGSDYPCKFGSGAGTDVKTMNNFKVGEKQTLSFSGSAVHGGGSCQLSVTLDKEPTQSSKFKVIHSIEGGCPGANGGPSTFSFDVPKELPNGEATFAWTWFNKVGNREMYMNCAPITVSGGSDDNTAFDSLPDMALANIAVGSGANCKTPESSDYAFPDPGASVEKVGSGPFAGLCGGAASGGGSSPGQSAAPAASSTPNNGLYTQPAASEPAASAPAASTPAASEPAATQPPAAVTSTVRTLITVTAPSAAQPSNTGGVFAPSASSAAAAPAPSAQPSSGTTPATGNTCSTDGAIVCNGDSQFGICDHGNVVWQAVAAGTKCENGAIAKRGLRHRALRAVV